MSFRPLTLLYAGVILLLLVAGAAVAIWQRRASGTVGEAPTEPTASTAAATRSEPASQRGATAESAQIPPPTAEWMTVAANPIVVEAPVVSPRGENQEISAGGNVVVLTADRRTFTLYVPSDAVLWNETVELAYVSQVKLPFSDGSISAVQITNLPRGLQKPAILTIDPPRRGLHDSAPSPAVFVVDAASRELHLHPFLRSEESSGSFTQDRYQLLITGNGTYGVANATADELRAIHARVPTSYLARLEMSLARALRETASRTPATSRHHWGSIVPVVFAQSAEDRQHLSELDALVVQQLREHYDQRLMPALKAFKGGCTDEKKAELAALNAEIVRWGKAVQVAGLSQGSGEKIDPDVKRTREMFPYLYQLEVARSEYFRKLREEFEQKEQKLAVTFVELIESTIKTLNACCQSQPKAWMPGDILELHRMAAAFGARDELTRTGIGDAQACACAVAAVTEGKGWTGTITQTETYSGEARSATARSRTLTVATHRYSLNVSVMGADENGEPVGLAMASGDQKSTTDRVDTDWACAVDEAGDSRELTGGRGAEMAPVEVSFLPEGKYRISFPYPVAMGLERHRWYKRREGCKNRFNDETLNRLEIRGAGVGPDFHSPIHGDTKNAMELTGSQTLTQPDTHLKRNRQATVTWNLRACEAK